jgi:DNA-binding response OmpR family regulator
VLASAHVATSTEPLGRLLAKREALSNDQLARAAAEGQSLPAFLGAVLAQGASETALLSAVAELRGIPAVDLNATTIDLDVLDNIPRAVAQADLVLAMSTEGGRLHIAVNGSQETHDVLEELRFITGQEVSPYAALPASLEQTIADAYDAKERGERFWRGPSAQPEVDIAVVLADEILEGEILELEPFEDEEEELELELDLGGGETPAEVVDSDRAGAARIIAVDDDPDILKLLERSLKSAGHIVELARDGREAEEMLKANRYDLVVLDAMLPHVHGFEICARLKANPRTRNLPVILVSAVYRGWRYAHDARESFGADEYLEKPFHIVELLRRVKELLDGAQAPQPAPGAHSEKLYQQATALLEGKKYAEARPLFEQVLVEDPFSVRAQFALARTLHEQGDAFTAITAYERAVELRPSLFAALRALAGLYEQKGFRRKAAEALERAVQVAPDAATREQLRARLLKLL